MDNNWPSTLSTILGPLDIVMFDIDYVQPRCSEFKFEPDYVLPLQWVLQPLVALLLFVSVVIAVVMFFLCGTYPRLMRLMRSGPLRVLRLPTESAELASFVNKNITVIIMFSLAVQPSAMRRAVQAFVCTKDPYGEDFMTAVPSIQCWTDYHVRLMVWAALSMVWTLGLPLTVYILIYRAKMTKTLHREETQQRFGLLYEPYRGDMWWFEIVHIVEKLFLIIQAEVIPTESVCATLQLINAVLVTSLHLHFKPHIRADTAFAIKIQYASVIIFASSGMVFLNGGAWSSYGVEYMAIATFLGATLHSTSRIWKEGRNNYLRKVITKQFDEKVVKPLKYEFEFPIGIMNGFDKEKLVKYFEHAENPNDLVALGEKVKYDLDATSEHRYRKTSNNNPVDIAISVYA